MAHAPGRRALRAAPKREEPRRPKYDAQLHGKAGFAWASETDLRGLRWFHKRSVDAAAIEDNKWKAREEKLASNLAKWIAWREWYPDAVWSGTRGDDEVTAAPPCAKPRTHARSSNGANRPRQPQQQQDDDFDPENY